MRETRLRILFVVRPGTLLRFRSVVPELAARGHLVHIAFTRKPVKRAFDFVQALVAEYENVTWDIAPRRSDVDGWRYVAWATRGLGDLARYAHPRYATAPVLRRRMARRILEMLERKPIEPIGKERALRLARRLAEGTDARLSERIVRLADRAEDVIPSSAVTERYLRERSPDLVVTTSVVRPASEEVDYVKSAQALATPNAVCVASWDNLTNKGMLKVVPDRVLVWNDVQVTEAVELHGIPRERVAATGAGIFDEWFARRPSRSHAEFAADVGLDPARSFVTYLCSSPLIAGIGEVAFVEQWIEALRASADERVSSLGVLIRPHPNYAGMWRRADLSRFENVTVYPLAGSHPVAPDSRADFFDTLAHTAAVVGINTTAMIEAAIVGRSVLTVLRSEFAQESTLHFRYLLEENGGFLHVASSLDGHVEQLRAVLAADAGDAERRRAFVGAFVRPHGLDRPATPIMADALEEVAAARATKPRRRRRPLLGPALGVAAWLNARHARKREAERTRPKTPAEEPDPVASG